MAATTEIKLSRKRYGRWATQPNILGHNKVSKFMIASVKPEYFADATDFN